MLRVMADDVATKTGEETAATGSEDTGAALELLTSSGVDLQSEEVQAAVLAGADSKAIIEKFGKAPEPAAAETEEEQEEQSEQEEEESAETEEEEQQEESAKEKPAAEDKLSKRYRFSDEADRKAVAAAKELGITLKEYFELQQLKQGQPESADGKKATEPAKVEPEAAKIDTDLAALDQEVKDLEEKIAKAEDDLEFAEALKLNRTLTRKQLEQAELRNRKAVAESMARSSYDAEQKVSQARMIAKYPSLGEDGRDSLAFTAFYQKRYEQDPAAFNRPDWIEALADEFAERYGVTESKSPAPKSEGADRKPAAKLVKPTSKTQVSAAKLLAGKEGAATSEPALPANESERLQLLNAELEKINRLPPGERDRMTAALFGGGRKQVARA